MAENVKHILIVEDDPYISKMYRLKFILDGYNVTVAENGKEGLEALKQVSPDIILLDILMPEMDGFEFMEIVKKDPKVDKIPILILSNLGQETEIKRGLDLGAVGYIIKTEYTPAEVVAEIKKNIGE